MSLDWSDPDLLMRRNDPSLTIKQIHIMPDWIGEEFPVCVMWSDGSIHTYRFSGSFNDQGIDPLDIIPRPLGGEGWAYEPELNQGVGLIYPLAVKPVADYKTVKVKWEVINDLQT